MKKLIFPALAAASLCLFSSHAFSYSLELSTIHNNSDKEITLDMPFCHHSDRKATIPAGSYHRVTWDNCTIGETQDGHQSGNGTFTLNGKPIAYDWTNSGLKFKMSLNKTSYVSSDVVWFQGKAWVSFYIGSNGDISVKAGD